MVDAGQHGLYSTLSRSDEALGSGSLPPDCLGQGQHHIRQGPHGPPAQADNESSKSALLSGLSQFLQGAAQGPRVGPLSSSSTAITSGLFASSPTVSPLKLVNYGCNDFNKICERPRQHVGESLTELIASMRYLNHAILDDLIILNLYLVGSHGLVAMDDQSVKEMLQPFVFAFQTSETYVHLPPGNIGIRIMIVAIVATAQVEPVGQTPCSPRRARVPEIVVAKTVPEGTR